MIFQEEVTVRSILDGYVQYTGLRTKAMGVYHMHATNKSIQPLIYDWFAVLDQRDHVTEVVQIVSEGIIAYKLVWAMSCPHHG